MKPRRVRALFFGCPVVVEISDKQITICPVKDNTHEFGTDKIPPRPFVRERQPKGKSR